MIHPAIYLIIPSPVFMAAAAAASLEIFVGNGGFNGGFSNPIFEIMGEHG